ncbi:hypothetical protein P4H65_21900 [Paenibacillus chitinolyticus]|uniref:hypothetical protein n=1 Tax=Paenibacillus chitinolyticus TaxID=79263 RepID=UPI002DBCC70D|nr:hypothetical protein [Paenibacillus chitinolyticus]MEC0248461.1 hypothetical protein [Paenibacillus chitinolyticus]
MNKKLVSVVLTGLLSLTLASSSFASSSSTIVADKTGDRTGSIPGANQYGRVTLTIDTIVWYDNYAYAYVYEACPGKSLNNLGSVKAEAYNRVGTNNFWMSAACSYYAEYYKYSPEGATVSSHLTIQNNP